MTMLLKNQRPSFAFGMLLLSTVLMACSADEGTVATTEAGQDAVIRLNVSSPVVANSAGAPALRAFSETTVNNLHVLVYNSKGERTGHAYGTGSSVTVSASCGNGCGIYALTNTNNENLFDDSLVTTEAKLKAMTTGSLIAMDSIKSNGNLLMTGSTEADLVAGENTKTFSVARVAAKNSLIITCGTDVTLTGYAVKDLPVKSWYVARPNASEATASDTAVGDDAVNPSTTTDWLSTATLSASGIATGTTPQYALTFYMYENRRGGRKAISGSMGDESDQTQKATYAPACATYVDLYVYANGTSITHRLYLGGTPYATNYNVERNCSYTYNITISASGGLVVGTISVQPWESVTGGSTSM
jgi:hypothetical protein